MFIEAIPKSVSPAVPGWWAGFKDEDCEEWWSPVAAWYPVNDNSNSGIPEVKNIHTSGEFNK
ncbi:hypothetical protein K5Z09_002946 [Escherichia coli]|nr:hypothetical protein [Escherichia coli]EHR8678959.1 hypothetical protein [Escherichia coli]EHR8983585.1 hypothetical protein [Escherichia coli]EHR9097732.1 hypothetical protein [Escherichia coli]EHR9216032.1 hypothetical protein [Escherichia coli]